MANSNDRRKLASPIIIIIIFVVILVLFWIFIMFWNSRAFQRSIGVTRPAPTNVHVNIQNGKPVVTWSPVDGAKSYNIYVFKSDGTFVVKVVDCGCVAKTIDIPCGNYFVQVSTNSNDGEGSKSNKVSFSVPCCPQPPLDAPRNFIYDGSELPGEITLSWSSVENATSYTVYRSRGGVVETDNFDEKKTTTDTKLTFTDLLPGTQHAFIIVANNKCNDPGYPSKCLKVDVCCSMPPPVEISSLTANDHSISISWNKTSLTSGYCVYIRQGKDVSINDYDDVQCVDETTTTFTFSGLDRHTLYAIGVLATNGCDYGPLRFGIIQTSEKFRPKHRKCHGPHCKNDDDAENDEDYITKLEEKRSTLVKNDKARADKLATGQIVAARAHK